MLYSNFLSVKFDQGVRGKTVAVVAGAIFTILFYYNKLYNILIILNAIVL